MRFTTAYIVSVVTIPLPVFYVNVLKYVCVCMRE